MKAQQRTKATGGVFTASAVRAETPPPTRERNGFFSFTNERGKRWEREALSQEQRGDNWRGRYHHWDSYPEGLGAELWALGAIATIGDAVVCYDRTYGE